MATGKVFGTDLQTLVVQQNVEVPKLVTHIIEFLTSKEGLCHIYLLRS